MKYSYSASLIRLSAAFTQACFYYINNNINNLSVPALPGGMIFPELNTNNQQKSRRVGIKFDNISAGKYFVLIHGAQRHSVESKTLKMRAKVPADSNVTTMNEFFGVLGRNEPSVMCQSTFH